MAAGWFDSLFTSDHAGNLSFVSFKPTYSAVTNGTTSGTATLCQAFQGATFKAFLVAFNNYRNSTATEQKQASATSFTRAIVIAGNTPQCTIWSGGSQVLSAAGDVTALGSSGGTVGGFSAVHAYDFGEFTSAFDTIGYGVSQGSTFTSTLLVIGW